MKSAIQFWKMHGCANDYVLIDARKATPKDPSTLAQEMCLRRTGVGAAGRQLVCASKVGDFRMRMFNPDGTEAEMCGNGIRCFAKWVYDHKLTKQKTLVIETLRGPLPLELTILGGKVQRVRVDMGTPTLLRRDIPVSGPPRERVIDEPLKVGAKDYRVTCMAMGNPHCVIWVNNVEDYPVSTEGPAIEKHPIFPNRTNVHFVEVIGRTEVRQRSWERGAAETWSCGTGASAVCVAGVLTGKTDRKVRVHVRGGELAIEWAKEDHVFLSGPADEVFEGAWGG